VDRVLACARVRVLMEPYVDGELEPAIAAAVRGHLAGCEECRRQHDQAMSLPFRLKALASPPPRETLVAGVMRAVAPTREVAVRAWTLLAPEAVLVAFILWYLSGLDGLSSIASGVFDDLQGLAGGSLPAPPQVDVLLLLALIALTAIAGYHLSILIRIAPPGLHNRRHA
jgi:anti-sigma factor RsiW